MNKIGFKGKWEVVHCDVEGVEIDKEIIDNMVVNEGINYMLGAALHGDTPISAWYIAPWSTNTAVAATQTYAAPGNTEATGYNEAVRQEWTEGAAAAQSITNSVQATITATGALSIYGFGIVGGGSAPTTKGNVAGGGKLLSSGMFAGVKTLAAGETIKLTYTLSGTSS